MSPVRKIAVIGTGAIGASWTALFLSKVPDVVATDIVPDAESKLPGSWSRPCPPLCPSSPVPLA